MSDEPGIGQRETGRLRVVAGILVAAAALSTAGCSGSVAVTPASLAAARQTWARAGLRDYDLEWTASGMTSAHYVVTVRGGTVQKVESMVRDGRRFELHPPEPRFYGIDGLFTTIADEIAQLKTQRPFGQPAGTKVAMRFTLDPRLGYPRYYRRDVVGTTQALAINVIRLVPVGTGAAAGAAAPAS